jgi:hypothetical protein
MLTGALLGMLAVIGGAWALSRGAVRPKPAPPAAPPVASMSAAPAAPAPSPAPSPAWRRRRRG